MKIPSPVFKNLTLIIFILAFIPVLLLSMQSSSFSEDRPLAWGFFFKKKEKKATTKVNSVIRSVLEDMKSRGVTSENVSEKNVSSFSTQLVKVDDWGNIHTYIYIKGANINKENIAELESREVRTELVNEKWGIVQGWIPFDRVDEVAGLDFVEKITNPDYGVKR